MKRYLYILGLVFFALALSFAFAPTGSISLAYANQELEGDEPGDMGGGEESGDPDMPDTNPGTGDGSKGLYSGPYGGMGSVIQPPDAGTGAGWKSRSESIWLWLRSTWQVFRVQFGWV